ncbi:MAG: cation-transporting P-type ATPase, partial [Opitutales bacterium]
MASKDQSSASLSPDALERPWHTLSREETLESLHSREDGLSDDEAGQRREQFGPNSIQEEQTVSPWRILLNQFTDPLIYVLIGALGVTLAIQSWADAIVIGAVLLINGTIGFIQEFRAESAVQSLMEMISPKATVRRGGEEREIESAELVPGDLV